MNKNHLFWIIPLVLVIGFWIGFFLVVVSEVYLWNNYPVINCIYTMEDVMNVDTNILPITDESQRKAIEYRCAIESIPDLDKNLELEDIWVIE